MRMSSILAPALVAASLGITATASRADTMPRPEPDQIVLNLEAEGRVETDTANVVARVETAKAAEQGEADETMQFLDRLVEGADWKIVRFDRNSDSTGLERVVATAEARVVQSKLTGIYERAKRISEPGRKVSIADIDFTPTVEALEKTRAALRKSLYRMAADEAAAAAAVWPDRGFRVHRIDFLNDGSGPQPMRVQMMARDTSGSAPAAKEATVAERMSLSATVVLAAPVRGLDD